MLALGRSWALAVVDTELQSPAPPGLLGEVPCFNRSCALSSAFWSWPCRVLRDFAKIRKPSSSSPLARAVAPRYRHAVVRITIDISSLPPELHKKVTVLMLVK